jgi:ferredoxin-NADP reductase
MASSMASSKASSGSSTLAQVPVLRFGGYQYPIDQTMGAGEGAVPTVGMIAAGSGITPMFPLLYSLLEEQEQSLAVKVALVYCCHSADEIMLRPDLDRLLAAHGNSRLQILYAVSEGEVDGKHMRRVRLSQALLQEVMPAAYGDGGPCICFCGPPGFNSEVERGLHQMGHRPERIHQF